MIDLRPHNKSVANEGEEMTKRKMGWTRDDWYKTEEQANQALMKSLERKDK